MISLMVFLTSFRSSAAPREALPRSVLVGKRNRQREAGGANAAVAGCDQARPARADGPRSIGNGSVHMTMRFCSSVTKSNSLNSFSYSSLAFGRVKSFFSV
jgi:hypothetical protein